MRHHEDSGGDGRLIVVSNRVSLPRETRAGGLASALDAALAEHGGLWYGWSGQVSEGEITGPRHERHGKVDYALLDLAPDDYAAYYQGYSNRTLWPLLHFRPDKLEFRRENLQGYVRVNREFARHLAPLIGDGDTVWVHDYHLIPLGQELRNLGINARIGFFLHVPLPSMEMLATLPGHRHLFALLQAYDLVGVQTDNDVHALRDYFARKFDAAVAASGEISVPDGRRFLTRAFPISIDPDLIAKNASLAMSSNANRSLVASLHGRALAVSVDRLDYSKGLIERFEAFGRFLDNYPEHLGRISMMQIAPVTRGDVPEYQELRNRLEQMAGSVNGRYAEPDWVPIRYINRSFHQATLAGFYRTARVGLVTPLRDGMNLVAKEYVAAQDPKDPGVLVLSKLAGAAHELPEALLVNPHDTDDTAEAIHQALAMPLDERQRRWQAMDARIRRHTIADWRESFLDTLRTIRAPH